MRVKRRIKHLLAIAMMITILNSMACDKNHLSNTCNVENPVEELAWLKDAIEEIKQDEFSWYGIAIYKGETVFYYRNCDPLVNYASLVLNCSGEQLGYTNDLVDELTDKRILWKHKNSVCDFRIN